MREQRWKCSHSQSCTYGKTIDEDQCKTCVLRVPLLYKLPGCGSPPPSKAIYKQPVFGVNGELIYQPTDAPEPSPPDGFERKEPWVFTSKWKECPCRAYLNFLDKDGILHLDTRCTLLDRKVCFEECDKCILDMEKVGAGKEEAEVPTLPGFGKQLSNYWTALRKWIAAGRPERSSEEVARLHREFCSQCSWFDSESSRCKGCGCNVKPAGAALLNKIRMATEHCPQNFW